MLALTDVASGRTKTLMMKLKGIAKNSFEQFVILSRSEGSG